MSFQASVDGIITEDIVSRISLLQTFKQKQPLFYKQIFVSQYNILFFQLLFLFVQAQNGGTQCAL